MVKIIFTFLILIPTVIIPQTKTWQQSSTEEFSLGTLNNVMVKNDNGGELQLIQPLVRQENDTLASSAQGFVSYNDAGNYVTGWINNSRVYVQEFNAEKQPLTGQIIVDDSGNVFSGAAVNLALLDKGEFVASWRALSPSLRFECRYVQFFDAGGKKIGKNQRVFNIIDGTGSTPVPIANQANNTYLILSPQLVDNNNTYHLYGMIYSAGGILLRDSIQMITTGGTMFELNPSGKFYKGKLALTWEGNNNNYGPGNIYTALYDSNCIPITNPIMIAAQRTSSSLAFDDNGNFCVTWVENSSPSQIYAQVLDSTGKKIGGIIQVSDNKEGTVRRQSITFNKNLYRVKWTLGFTDGRADQLWESFWKFEKITDGSYISSVFDAGDQKTIFKTLSWNGIVSIGTQIKFQLRSSSTRDGIESAAWIGPSLDSIYYINSSGEAINSKINPNRYLQAKILFHSSTVGNTPILNDFSVSYISSDTIAPLPPANVSATGKHREITIRWDKSISQDVKEYRIYKVVGNNNFDKTSFIQVDAGKNSFVDSSVVYTEQYRYAVTAVDSAFNESTMSLSKLVSPSTMTIFVSPSGSPEGNGTAAKPFSKIMDAIGLTGKGDTVLILPGDYDEAVKLNNDISLIGSNVTATKIISSNAAPVLTTGNNDVVKGCTFLCNEGISCRGDSVLITENIFLHQGSGFDIGITTALHQDITISKNIINNFSIGIQAVSNIAPAESQTTISNNIINCQIGVQNVRSNVEFTNNTFIVKGSQGIGVSISDGNSEFMNNCFAGYPSESGFVRSISYGSSAVYSFQYNDVWNFNGDQNIQFSSTNISVDPQFKNFAKNDFHLNLASGCINKGNPAKEYDDLDGTRNDIGAYGGPDPMPGYLTISLSTDISLSNVSGFPGDTVLVNVNLSNAAGLKSGEINIKFDSSILAFLQAIPAQLLKGFEVKADQLSVNTLLINLSSQNEINSGAGNIIILKFVLNPTINSNVQGAVEIGNVNLYDAEGNQIFISSVTDGSCIIRANKEFINKVFVNSSNIGISDGTILHPYKTIQEGIDNAKPGDTVSVAAGIYTGPISMRSNIFVSGLGANTTTIECPNITSTYVPGVVIFKGADSSGISGFSLINYSPAETVIEVSSSGAFISMNKIEQAGLGMYSIITDTASNIVIQNNYFTGPQDGRAGALGISANNAVISRNVFSGASGPNLINIQSNSNTIISNNRIYMSDASMGLTANNTTNMIIANNLFYGSSSFGTALTLMNSDSTKIINNVFDVKNSGITENNGTQEIYNNIFTGNNVALNIESGTKHQYNLFWNNRLNFGKGKIDSTEIIADPLFVNQQEGNYKLQPSSPAKNAGDPISKWDDNDGTRNDIGLYGGPYADSTMFTALNSKLQIGNVPGSPGDTVSVPVYAVGITGISGIQVLLTFNSEKLILTETYTTPNTQDFVLLRKNFGSSIVQLTLEGQRSIVLDSGAILELKFIINKNAAGNIPISFQNVQLVEASSEIIQGVAFENGAIMLSINSVSPGDPVLPRAFELYQNYPNPFNPTTKIKYSVPRNSFVSLKIYNILGQKVKNLFEGIRQAGNYIIIFNGSRLASGIYFCRMKAVPQSGRQTGNFVSTKKLVLLK